MALFSSRKQKSSCCHNKARTYSRILHKYSILAFLGLLLCSVQPGRTRLRESLWVLLHHASLSPLVSCSREFYDTHIKLPLSTTLLPTVDYRLSSFENVMSAKDKPTEVFFRADITPVDILCGRDKKSYNHIANRRFRYLMAFNMERYTETESRTSKSLVVQSLLNQILDNGGRFLVKRRRDDAFIQASERVARDKISHAFRDKKLPHSIGLRSVKTKLCKLVVDKERFGDDLFIAASARILRTQLPEADCPGIHDCVDHLLNAELEKMYEQMVKTKAISNAQPSSIVITIPIQNHQEVEPQMYQETELQVHPEVQQVHEEEQRDHHEASPYYQQQDQTYPLPQICNSTAVTTQSRKSLLQELAAHQRAAAIRREAFELEEKASMLAMQAIAIKLMNPPPSP